jgi:endo-1,4-beta-xylanase
LPVLTRRVNVHAGEVPLDGSATDAFEWELLPDAQIGSGDSGFQLRWEPDHLIAYVDVADDTDDGAGDTVDLFWGDQSLTVLRTGGVDSAEVSSTADGYRVVALLPADGLEDGGSVDFDVRITDGDTGAPTSWNDPNDAQEDGERLGLGNLIEPVGFTDVAQTGDAPEIDGEVDAVWDGAPVVSTGVQVEGSGGASADVRLLWAGSELYALAEVTDPQLDDGSSNPWEQDSVEFFVDPVNAKSGPYNPEDGQYRVNFLNEVSFGATDVGDRLTSGTSVTDDGYIVEAAIDLGYEPETGQLIGLELQVNDGTDGARTAVRTWTDPTGQSFQSTERWGVARLGGTACDDTVEGLNTGPLMVSDGITCLAEGARQIGPVSVQAGAGLIAEGATVVGRVRADAADTVVLGGGLLVGSVEISGTTGEVTITGNRIVGPVRLTGNTTGDTPITVADNTIVGLLACSGNEPPPVGGDAGNTVIGVARGQCRDL